jgi:hypothetical protein
MIGEILGMGCACEAEHASNRLKAMTLDNLMEASPDRRIIYSLAENSA